MALHEEKGHFKPADMRLGISPDSPAVAEAEKSAEELAALLQKDGEQYFWVQDPNVQAVLAKRALQPAAPADGEDEEGAAGKAAGGRGQDLSYIFMTGPRAMEMLAQREEAEKAKNTRKDEKADIRKRVAEAKLVYESTLDATGVGTSFVRKVTAHEYRRVKGTAGFVLHLQVWWWHISAPRNKHNVQFRPYTEFEHDGTGAGTHFTVEEVQQYVTAHKITKFVKTSAA